MKRKIATGLIFILTVLLTGRMCLYAGLFGDDTNTSEIYFESEIADEIESDGILSENENTESPVENANESESTEAAQENVTEYENTETGETEGETEDKTEGETEGGTEGETAGETEGESEAETDNDDVTEAESEPDVEAENEIENETETETETEIETESETETETESTEDETAGEEEFVPDQNNGPLSQPDEIYYDTVETFPKPKRKLMALKSTALTASSTSTVHTIWQSSSYVYCTWGTEYPTALRYFKLDNADGQYAYCLDPDKDYPTETTSVTTSDANLLRAVILLSPGGKYYSSGVDGLSIAGHYALGNIQALSEGWYDGIGYCLTPDSVTMDYIYAHFLLAYVYHGWGDYNSYQDMINEYRSEGSGYYTSVQCHKITEALYTQLKSDIAAIEAVLSDTSSTLYLNAVNCTLSIGSNSANPNWQKAAWITSQDDPAKISTSAVNKESGLKILAAKKGAVIDDSVSYEGLKTGGSYTLKGILIDASTGGQIRDADGNPVSASKTFSPSSSTGSVTLSLSFNASSMQGKTLVVYEELYLNEGTNSTKVAEHKDLSSQAQTIYVPSISTSAVDASDNDKTITAKVASIKDTVSLTNLLAGYSYVLTGTLYSKSTGEKISVATSTTSSKNISESVTFTASSESMTKQLTFNFDAYQLNWQDIVVFEELKIINPLDGNSYPAAEEKNISDTAQTVSIRQPSSVPDTGVSGMNLESLFAVLGILAGGAAAILLFRKTFS